MKDSTKYLIMAITVILFIGIGFTTGWSCHSPGSVTTITTVRDTITVTEFKSEFVPVYKTRTIYTMRTIEDTARVDSLMRLAIAQALTINGLTNAIAPLDTSINNTHITGYFAIEDWAYHALEITREDVDTSRATPTASAFVSGWGWWEFIAGALSGVLVFIGIHSLIK